MSAKKNVLQSKSPKVLLDAVPKVQRAPEVIVQALQSQLSNGMLSHSFSRVTEIETTSTLPEKSIDNNAHVWVLSPLKRSYSPEEEAAKQNDYVQTCQGGEKLLDASILAAHPSSLPTSTQALKSLESGKSVSNSNVQEVVQTKPISESSSSLQENEGSKTNNRPYQQWCIIPSTINVPLSHACNSTLQQSLNNSTQIQSISEQCTPQANQKSQSESTASSLAETHVASETETEHCNISTQTQTPSQHSECNHYSTGEKTCHTTVPAQVDAQKSMPLRVNTSAFQVPQQQIGRQTSVPLVVDTTTSQIYVPVPQQQLLGQMPVPQQRLVGQTPVPLTVFSGAPQHLIQPSYFRPIVNTPSRNTTLSTNIPIEQQQVTGNNAETPSQLVMPTASQQSFLIPQQPVTLLPPINRQQFMPPLMVYSPTWHQLHCDCPSVLHAHSMCDTIQNHTCQWNRLNVDIKQTLTDKECQTDDTVNESYSQANQVDKCSVNVERILPSLITVESCQPNANITKKQGKVSKRGRGKRKYRRVI